MAKLSGAAASSVDHCAVPSAAASTTIPCARSGRRARIGATLRCQAAPVVTSTRARAFARRTHTGSGPKAENRALNTAPALRVPNAAT
jgi:hypothetical protein